MSASALRTGFHVKSVKPVASTTLRVPSGFLPHRHGLLDVGIYFFGFFGFFDFFGFSGGTISDLSLRVTERPRRPRTACYFFFFFFGFT
jgi:hypothetical protein